MEARHFSGVRLHKKEKENLTKEERNKIKKAIPILEKELFGGER